MLSSSKNDLTACTLVAKNIRHDYENFYIYEIVKLYKCVDKRKPSLSEQSNLRHAWIRNYKWFNGLSFSHIVL
jgi:hypothetical protein